jgi:phosphoglycerate kinase
MVNVKELRSVKEIPLANGEEPVILRLDMDVPKSDNKRLKNSIPTLEYLLQNGYTPIVLGHKKRPKGIGYEEEFSLYPVYLRFKDILEKELCREIKSTFIDDITDEEKIQKAINENEIVFAENIRFHKKEKKGDTSLYFVLQKFCQFFVYDAIAVAHRDEASIILHREMETFYGFNFMKEFEAMQSLKKQKGQLVILGGTKKDKLDNLAKISQESWKVFIGGKLSIFREEVEEKIIQELGEIPDNIIWAELSPDGYDLSGSSITILKNLIKLKLKVPKIIIWCGALGWFEEGYIHGTNEIAKAIIESDSYVAIGGGDTAASIIELGGKDKIDFLCSAGGAFLFALAFGPENLPAVV